MSSFHFICSFVHLFICSFFYLFICLFVHLFIFTPSTLGCCWSPCPPSYYYCRVLAYSSNMGMLLISQPSFTALAPGFGVRQFNVMDLKVGSFISLAKDQVKHFERISRVISEFKRLKSLFIRNISRPFMVYHKHFQEVFWYLPIFLCIVCIQIYFFFSRSEICRSVRQVPTFYSLAARTGLRESQICPVVRRY